jgi:glutathione S-transferase
VDGDFVLTESNAMIQYLAEAYGDFRLSSRDPKRRADLARWLFWEAAHWQPAWTAVVAPAVGHLLVPERIAPPDRPVRWNDATFDTTVRFLDAHLAARRWIGGDELGLADFSVAGMMTYARATGFPFPAHPHVARWYAAVESLDAWRATAAGPWTSPASPTSAPSL